MSATGAIVKGILLNKTTWKIIFVIAGGIVGVIVLLAVTKPLRKGIKNLSKDINERIDEEKEKAQIKAELEDIYNDPNLDDDQKKERANMIMRKHQVTPEEAAGLIASSLILGPLVWLNPRWRNMLGLK